MSRKKTSFKARDVAGPPDDEPWLWFSAGLLRSAAWLTASPHLRRLLDFLHVEHLRHDRLQNGALLAPYGDLQKFGIGRRFIQGAITEGETRGLIEVERGFRTPSRYRLTYMPSVTVNPKTKVATKHAPTNEWKHFVAPKKRALKPAKAVLLVHDGEHQLVHDGELKAKPDSSVPAIPAGSLVHDGAPAASARSCTPSTDSRGEAGDGDPLAGSVQGDVELAGSGGGGRTCRSYVVTPGGIGHRLCGQPVGADGEHCPEHVAAMSRVFQR
jgi:hypothetical protein